MSFLDGFVQKKVRESSGSRSSNRFDFQKNWSLCELLDLHSNHPDYLMVFEHHEDVVVFNSESDPSNAIFYQVKSKASGNWTIGALTQRKNGSPSIFEKLYDNYVSFPENTNRLVFTSNQVLSANLRNGKKSVELGKVRFADLADECKEQVRTNVEPEEQDYCDIVGLHKIETEKIHLSPTDHTTLTKGKIVEFFEKLHPESEINVSLVYKTFFDEIRRKTNYEKPTSEVVDLKNHKSISKSDFKKMIGAVVSRVSDNDLWQQGVSILTNEGFSFSEIRSLKSSWQQYIIKKLDATDDLHARFRADVRNALSKTTPSTFKELVETISTGLLKKHVAEISGNDIKAAALYEVLRDDPIQEINKKSAEKTK